MLGLIQRNTAPKAAAKLVELGYFCALIAGVVTLWALLLLLVWAVIG